MRRQRPDRRVVLDVRVAVADADDDRAARPRRHHGGGEPVALRIAQGEEARHGPAQMRLEADLLLDEGPGRRHVGGLGALPRLAEMLFDGVAHQGRFLDRLRLGLDPEPGLSARDVADIVHRSPRRSVRAVALSRDVGANRPVLKRRCDAPPIGPDPGGTLSRVSRRDPGPRREAPKLLDQPRPIRNRPACSQPPRRSAPVQAMPTVSRVIQNAIWPTASSGRQP